jgi:hypothetical protein
LGLTYWHSAKCQLLFFFLVFYFSEYPYQTEFKRSKTIWRFFLDREDNLGVKEAPEGRLVGPTRHQGAPEAPHAPWWVVGPMGVSSTASRLYKYPYIPETLGESTKHKSSRHKIQNHEIQTRALFRHSAGGEHDHGGVHHPHWWSSDDAWVVHHRPTGL